MTQEGSRRLLTFRLDTERRQRLRARLAREGRTMSEVVTSGLRQYVQHARHREERGDGGGTPVLPERIAARLRELRSSGRSELLSATLAALHEAGWPLRPLAEDYDVTQAAVEHLLGRYGALAEDVLRLVRADSGLGRPLAEGHPYLRAEVAYAVTHESALHVEDVLMRRTRLFIEAADGGAGAAADVAAIMGRLLGWSRRRRAAEIRRYLDLLETERVVPAAPAAGVPSAGEPVVGTLAAAG